MSATVILNPYANRWNSRSRWPQAEAALKAAGVAFELQVTDGPGHAIQIAERAAREARFPIIAAGGDGTIGEVVNGLGLAQGDGPLGPLGILPLGSANDLGYALRIPTDLQAAARVIATGEVRLMDLGRVDGKLFANNSAVGLEPFVTTLQVKITRVKGMLRYLVAALQGIWARPAWTARLAWDDGSYEGPLTLMSIGIGSRSGGVFYMIPHADPFDGKFTFAFGYRSGRREMLALLPRAMKPDKGSYVEAEGMWEINTTRLKVHLDKPSPAHTDGELFSEMVSDLDYELLPARLRILTPP